MTDYLTIEKIFKDSVALYRQHFLYITILFGAVMVPYALLGTVELPEIGIIIVPIFIFLIMLIEIVSTKFVSTGYLDFEFDTADQFKKGLAYVIPYTLITLLSGIVSFFGISMMVIPGILATIFANFLKIDFIINGGTIRERFISSFELMKKGAFIKLIKIYIIPVLLQFGVAIAAGFIFDPATIEEDIISIYPIIIASLIILYPVVISFRTAVYFNTLKYNQLNSTNQFV